MKDINNALLHIKAKHNGEIPHQYGSRECAKLMDSYAKEYHQAKLKLLGIADVVGQSFFSITDFEKYISDECEERFGFVCEPFTIAKYFFYVNVPKNKVEDVKKLVFESMPILKNCDIQPSRYFSGVRTLEFTP